MNEIDQFVEHVMEMIASRRIDKEELKKNLISNWSELDKRGEKLMKEMKEILKDAGATDAQIEWGINLPKLSWRKEKRIRELETELKDVLVEMTQSRCGRSSEKNGRHYAPETVSDETKH